MEESVIKTAVANGGISAILFIIWYFTVKYFSKQHEETLKHYQEQFSQTIEQSRTQATQALTQNQITLDRLFSVMQEDVKYKSLIAENITKLENKIDITIKDFTD